MSMAAPLWRSVAVVYLMGLDRQAEFVTNYQFAGITRTMVRWRRTIGNKMVQA